MIEAASSPLTLSTPLGQSIAARAEGRSGGIKNLSEGRADLYQVNPTLINIEEGFNVRDFESPRMLARIDELAQSIAKVGLKRALKVRMKNGKLVLVDGECRLRAIIRAIEEYGAEIRTVKVELVDRAFSDAEAVLSIAVENDAYELTPLEKGTVYKRLEAFGWSLADIAQSVGLTTVRVTQLIELTAVPEAVKQMIRDGAIAPTLAGRIAKDNDFDEARTIEAVTSAQKVAAQAGRSKITPRSVVSSRPSLKSSLTDIFSAASACEDEDEGETVVILTLSREKADALEALLKIKLV